MAKSRRNRARAQHRSDPITKQLKPPKPPSDPELAALRQERILPVLKELQSAEPKSRTAAAGAIANIIQDPRCRKLLLREHVVHTLLTETLADSSLESKAAGWEILKVLTQTEESDFCVHLWRSDVLTAADFATNLILSTLTALEPPFAKATKAQQRFVWEISASIVTLLGALAEARDEISNAIAGHQAITRFLFTLVSFPGTPAEILDDVLSCLTTLSEDSRELAQAVVDDQISGCYSRLLQAKDSGGSKGVGACALLHNVFTTLDWHDQSRGKDGACDAILVPSLALVLERTKLDAATSNGEHGRNSYEILQLALDVLASIGTELKGSLEKEGQDQDQDQDQPEWDGFENDDVMSDDGDGKDANQGGSDAEMEEDGEQPDGDEQEDLDADMEVVTGVDEAHGEAVGIDDLPTLKELIQKAIPQIVHLARIQPASDEEVAIQSSAFSALNNIAWTLSCVEFADGENAGILKAWSPTARSIWSRAISPVLASDTADLNLASMVTSLAWAVSRSLGGATPLKDDEYRKFIALYKASGGLETEEGDDPFQSLGAKCIGVLGQLARDPAPIPLNRDVGVFLMSLLSSLPELPTAHAVEGLNQVFDIYGDENSTCDKEVFWKDGFLKHLEEILPKARTMARAVDKRTSEELRTRADEAVMNLNRFIQYKKKHMP